MVVINCLRDWTDTVAQCAVALVVVPGDDGGGYSVGAHLRRPCLLDREHFTLPKKSEPVYVHSTGSDASLFHDDDVNVVALERETRTEYEKPGPISIMEYDPVKKQDEVDRRRLALYGGQRRYLDAGQD